MPRTGGWSQRARLRQGLVQTHVAQKCCSVVDGALFGYSLLSARGHAPSLINQLQVGARVPPAACGVPRRARLAAWEPLRNSQTMETAVGGQQCGELSRHAEAVTAWRGRGWPSSLMRLPKEAFSKTSTSKPY